MKRAFISAPLLGTIIFLAAVLFVSHITQTEKIEVSNTVRETYHNTIVSTLQNYRSDLGSLFAVSVGKSIEKYLTGACWDVFELKNSDGTDNAALLKGSPPLGFNRAQWTTSARSSLDVFNFDDVRDKPISGTKIFSSPDSPIAAEQGNGQLDYHELRYKQCSKISDILRQAICPLDPKYGMTAWLAATRNAYNFQGIKFDIANDALVEQFEDNFFCQFTGFNITNEYYFNTEGIEKCRGKPTGAANGFACRCIASGPNKNCRKCEVQPLQPGQRDPACKEVAISDVEARAFSCVGVQGAMYYGAGRQRCDALVGDSQFDCRNFAENLDAPLRCCSTYARANLLSPANKKHAGKCCDAGLIAQLGGDKMACSPNPAAVPAPTPNPAGYVVPGCESGSFFVKLNVLANDETFKSLPRVKAQDSAGNTLQSGALGENDFLVQIKYPLFKYYDAAFKIYAATAYGAQAKSLDFLDPAANMKKFAECRSIPTSAARTGNRNNIAAGAARSEEEKQREQDKIIGECRAAALTQTMVKKSQDNSEGVIEGWLQGAASFNAINKPEPQFKFERHAPADLGSNRDAARRTAAGIFYNTFLEPSSASGICRLVTKIDDTPAGVCDINPSPINDDANLCSTQIWLRGHNLYDTANEGFYALCGNSPNGPTPASQIRTLLSAGQFISAEDCTPGNSKQCAFINQLAFTIKLVDYDPAFVTSSTDAPGAVSNNSFCFRLSPMHDNPDVPATP